MNSRLLTVSRHSWPAHSFSPFSCFFFLSPRSLRALGFRARYTISGGKRGTASSLRPPVTLHCIKRLRVLQADELSVFLLLVLAGLRA